MICAADRTKTNALLNEGANTTTINRNGFITMRTLSGLLGTFAQEIPKARFITTLNVTFKSYE